jgi:hypothetical protein
VQRSRDFHPLTLLTQALFVIASSSALVAGPVEADSSSSDDLLAKSIAVHDPLGLWQDGVFRLHLEETRPDGPSRKTTLLIDNSTGRFEIATQRDGSQIDGVLEGDGCELRLDGSTEFTEEEREKYRLTCERLEWLRNYYVYLWGLPMKLLDSGTALDPDVLDTTYQDRSVQALRVSYEPEVGSDIWYFYLDTETHAVAGYRFFHDEAQGDGEYITLDGMIEAGGLRLPKARAWYTNAEDRYLGTDTLVSLEILSNGD